MKRWFLRLIGWTLTAAFVVAVAAVPLGAAFELGRSTYYAARFQPDTAVVTGCDGKWTKQGTKYAQVVRADSGLQATARWRGSKAACETTKGQRVSVWVRPDGRAMVLRTFAERWLLGLVLGGLTALFVVGALRKRRARR